MNRHERRMLVEHAILLRRIGEDLAVGKLESDQVAKWLRILSLRVQTTRRDWIHSARYTWLATEVDALRDYEHPEPTA